MINWKLKSGNFLFRYRSFTPVPLIVLVFIIFNPVDLGEKNLSIDISGLLVSLLGEAIRIMAVGYSFTGTSGREGYLRADALNTSGIYSITRNPLYTGNFFIFSGLVVVFSNLFAVLVFALFLILQYYLIILAEENYLKEKYGTEYDAYCRRVRRIVPTFKNYRKNRIPFRLKKVVFKENDSLFNMLLVFILVLLYKERVFAGRIHDPHPYIIFAGILIVLYVLVKVVKKKEAAQANEG